MPRFTVMRLLQLTAALSIALAVVYSDPSPLRNGLLMIGCATIVAVLMLFAVLLTTIVFIALFYYSINAIVYLFGATKGR